MDLLNQASLFEGYGEASLQETNELVKAIQASEGITDIAALTGGGALQVQSLETQLAMLTFQEKHIKFYKDIGVSKAFSTLEEYSVQDGYGHEGGFVGQLENPEEADPNFRREFAVVKYIRTLWKVADVLQYAKTISDAEVLAVQSAMMRALRQTEQTLFFGDSDMIPESFDGIVKTIKSKATSQHIFDLRGANINEYQLKQGAQLIGDNYGTPTHMYVSHGVQTTIDNILDYSKQRINQEQVSLGSGLIALGHTVTQMRSAFGTFNFVPDIFINPEAQGVPMIKDPANPGLYIEGPTSAKSPATPTFTLTVNAPIVAGSKWKATGDGGAIAGTYNYRVVAINRYGKSQAAAAQSDTVAASGSITIDITSGGGSYAPTAYEIYRETTPGSGKIYYLTTVKVSGSPTNYEDKNDDLSGTSVSLLVDNTSAGELRTMTLSQLAPMHKVEYAKIAPYRWGTVNFYVVPKWYTPLRYILFKNVGVAVQSKNPVIDL